MHIVVGYELLEKVHIKAAKLITGVESYLLGHLSHLGDIAIGFVRSPSHVVR